LASATVFTFGQVELQIVDSFGLSVEYSTLLPVGKMPVIIGCSSPSYIPLYAVILMEFSSKVAGLIVKVQDLSAIKLFPAIFAFTV